MPSYRYTKDIAPDQLAPEPQRTYTRGERWGNWWHYHWKWVLIALAVAVAVVATVVGLLGRVEPDMRVGVLAPYTLPDAVTARLEEALAGLVGDVNGDGRAVVTVECYTVAAFEDGQDEAGVDPYLQMAGTTRLATALSSGDVMLFLLAPEGAAFYQAQYGILAGPDGLPVAEGTDPADFAPTFAQLPVLAALDMALELDDGTTADAAALLGGYYVGVRPLAGSALAGKQAAEAGWEQARALLARLAGAA